MEALNIDASQCIVWGGGGTLKMMRSVLADASFYSARTASPREFSKEAKSAKVMIIAIQNSDLEKGAKKPEVFSGLEKVIDLGYKEDSFAKEWALENKLEYINGLEFLTLQGLAQRKVWK